MLTWDEPDKRYYEHGLDRGVAYPDGEAGIPWNGFTGFDESQSGETAMYYRDGIVYMADADASDFTGKLTAIFWPEAFGRCIGITEATDGLWVDNQKPQRFGLSYRSLVGSGTEGDMFGYKIHIVYNCMATIGTRSRKTLGDSPVPVEFNFDIVCTPVKLPGYRPTAHYIIDTRGMSPSVITQLENILYEEARLPTPTEMFDLMNFGDAIQVVSYADGTFDVSGSSDNVLMTSPSHIQLNNINATAPDAAGHYTISDGGDTTVVVG